MATAFTYHPDGPVFVSELAMVTISTNAASCVFNIMNRSGQSVYKETLWASSGKIVVYGVDKILKHIISTTGLVFDKFYFNVTASNTAYDSDQMTCDVIYLDRTVIGVSAKDFVTNNFLTTLGSRQVPSNLDIPLAFFKLSDDSPSVTVACELYDSVNDNFNYTTLTFQLDMPASSVGLAQFNFNPKTLEELASSVLGPNIGVLNLRSFTVVAGARSLTCFVNHDLDNMRCFYFRNLFNALELAALHHATKRVSKAESSEAYSNGRKSVYDRRLIKSFEVETAPLTLELGDWIDQLLTSPDVKTVVALADDGSTTLADVVITDSTCEISDEAEASNTVKFTWQFAEAANAIIANAPSAIFTEQFNTTFS